MIVCNARDVRCVVYMLRYSLGRMTGAVEDVQQIILENVDNIRDGDLKRMIEEIKEYDEMYGLGMECDKRSWYTFIERLEELI